VSVAACHRRLHYFFIVSGRGGVHRIFVGPDIEYTCLGMGNREGSVVCFEDYWYVTP